jgi:hypothetical protein
MIPGTMAVIPIMVDIGVVDMAAMAIIIITPAIITTTIITTIITIKEMGRINTMDPGMMLQEVLPERVNQIREVS